MRFSTPVAALAVLLIAASGVQAQSLRAPAVYPNPLASDGVLTVAVDGAEGARAEVLDVLGRRVSLDGPLAAGTYLVRAVYADGRATAPARFTSVATGRVEVRLVDAAAPEAAAPEAIAEAPATEAAAAGLACAPGNVTFAGFQHTVLTDGSLRVRSDLTPQTLRAQPSRDFATVDFSTCFGSVQGYSFRYVDESAPGNRSLRVLSPASVGNTQVSYTADYVVDGSPGTALYGTYEVSIDDDSDPGSPTIPAVGIGFDANYSPAPTRTRTPASKMGGGYQIIVLDANDEVVYEGNASDITPLFATPTGGRTRINLLRSILLTEAVDGFQVDGEFKPGSISAVLSFESDDGGPVRFHLGEGSPVATGTSVHITPSVFYSDAASFMVSDVRTYATGLNRFGIRTIHFAAGAQASMPVKAGGFSSSIASWGRLSGDATEFQQFDIVDAGTPYVFVGEGTASPLSSPIPDYGILWGREPAPLMENSSEEIDVLHAPLFRKGSGFTGYIIDEDGEFYQTVSQIRNVTDNQSEAITVRFERVNGEIQVSVQSQSGHFTDYAFRYEDDNISLNRTFDVGTTNRFAVSEIEFWISGAVGGQFFPSSATQNYFNGFGVVLNGSGDQGTVFITPNWDSDFAEVEVRSHGAETDQPHTIFGVENFRTGDRGGPVPVKNGSASHWAPANR